MTEKQMSYLRELAEAATPGERMPLVYAYATMDEMVEECSQALRNRPDGTKVHFVWAPSIGEFVAMTGNGPKSEANAAFIAAANPTTVLALIAEIERLEAERDARPAITAEDARGWADAREAFYEPTLDEKAAWERVDDTLHAHAKKAASR